MILAMLGERGRLLLPDGLRLAVAPGLVQEPLVQADPRVEVGDAGLLDALVLAEHLLAAPDLLVQLAQGCPAVLHRVPLVGKVRDLVAQRLDARAHDVEFAGDPCAVGPQLLQRLLGLCRLLPDRTQRLLDRGLGRQAGDAEGLADLGLLHRGGRLGDGAGRPDLLVEDGQLQFLRRQGLLELLLLLDQRRRVGEGVVGGAVDLLGERLDLGPQLFEHPLRTTDDLAAGAERPVALHAQVADPLLDFGLDDLLQVHLAVADRHHPVGLADVALQVPAGLAPLLDRELLGRPEALAGSLLRQSQVAEALLGQPPLDHRLPDLLLGHRVTERPEEQVLLLLATEIQEPPGVERGERLALVQAERGVDRRLAVLHALDGLAVLVDHERLLAGAVDVADDLEASGQPKLGAALLLALPDRPLADLLLVLDAGPRQQRSGEEEGQAVEDHALPRLVVAHDQRERVIERQFEAFVDTPVRKGELRHQKNTP